MAELLSYDLAPAIEVLHEIEAADIDPATVPRHLVREADQLAVDPESAVTIRREGDVIVAYPSPRLLALLGNLRAQGLMA